MTAYEGLAPVYDRLTEDVEYSKWADYLERHFNRQPRKVATVLDLACGTGTLSCLLAERGYEVIGADASSEMLSAAAEKARKLGSSAPIFLRQDMTRLDLYGTVDACVCMLDSINYAPGVKALGEAFRRVLLFLEPGGVFLFDLNLPEKLRGMDGQIYLDEREDVFCTWRCAWSERHRTCTFGVDIFVRENGLWRRSAEEHTQYAYTPQEITGLLHAAGFSSVKSFGALRMRAPRAEDGRIFFRAKKPGGQ